MATGEGEMADPNVSDPKVSDPNMTDEDIGDKRDPLGAREAVLTAELRHELEVHQLELEMQNEELRRSELSLAQTRDRYFDLFDLAPVAYLTIDREGAILECNFAAAKLLGQDRSSLLGHKFARFVRDEHANDFHLFHQSLYESGARQACKIRCKRQDGAMILAHVQGIALHADEGEQATVSIAIVDIGEISRVQNDLDIKGAALKRTEDRLASFMRVAHECVLILTPGGIIKDVNAATLTLLDYTEEQVIGRHIASLDDENSQSFGPGGGPVVRSAEVKWVDRHGELHSVQLSISPIADSQTGVADEYLCTAQDITKRLGAEEKMRVSEKLLRQMAETIEDGFYIRSVPGGELSYVSPAYEEIFGLSREELIEDPILPMTIVHPDDVEGLQSAYNSFVRGDPCDEEYRIVRRDGETRWIRERAFQVDKAVNEPIEHIVGVAQDVTDQRQLENELRQGQKMEAIGQLASGVAHDFNNILMGIHGCASIALSKIEEESEVTPFLDAIRKSSESGTAIIKQLLIFSSKRDRDIRTFDLNELLRNDQTMLARLLGDDVVLKIVTGDHEHLVRMDPGQIEQILMNLAINARDAMPNGGELTISTQLAAPTGRTPGSYFELVVKDTGVGMSAATRERIFEPFFTTKGIGEGTGLGLSTVYGIVQETGGTIRCRSEPGMGTTFIVRLPRVEKDSDAEAEFERVAAAEKRAISEEGAGTILLVEDEETVRLATRLYLESGGYEVLEAATGPQAIQILNDDAVTPHLLLTDVGLPGFSGAGLAARARELISGLPVVFMSAHPAEWLVANGRLAEGEATLQKPFDKRQLLKTIGAMLGDAAEDE